VSPRRGLLILLGLGILALAGSSVLSGATYTATSVSRANVFAAALDWVAPTVSVTAPAGPAQRGTVTVVASATDAGSGIASVRLQRSPAGQATWSDICTDALAPFSCALNTTALAEGRYDLRAIALDRAGNSATSAIVADVLVDNNAPTVTLDDPGSYVRATITLTATAADGTGAGVASVKLQSAPADTTTWTDICTDTTTPYTCSLNTTTLANDAYDLRAIATDAAGNATTSDSVAIDVDNVLPTITMTDPGATLSGTVTLATAPADADSGVAGVTIQRSIAGLNTWTDVCSIAASPWSCRFDTTTVGDGLYDFRATAVDGAGNARTSASVTLRRVDNTTVSTVSVEDPGAFLSGTVTLTANANALGGVASVRIQRSKAGAGTWTDICTDATAPYACAFDTTTAATPDGLYDLRAIMTSSLGATTTSATVANRAIDNTPVRGVDVQTINAAGATGGRPEAGDRLILTYSDQMKPSTLIPGWTGTAAATVYVRLSDAANVESIALTANAAGSQPTGLGSIAPNANFLRKNRTVTFTSTAVLSTSAAGGSVVTITLGAASGTVRTYSTAVAMRWTPSAAATDLNGRASSSATVTETGPLDRDF
jgi:hypothetical protein